MALLPLWFMRLMTTLLIIWLIWALTIGPWLFATESFLRSHYWWMWP